MTHLAQLIPFPHGEEHPPTDDTFIGVEWRGQPCGLYIEERTVTATLATWARLRPLGGRAPGEAVLTLYSAGPDEAPCLHLSAEAWARLGAPDLDVHGHHHARFVLAQE